MKKRTMALIVALVVAMMSVPFVSGATEITGADYKDSAFEYVLHEESTGEFAGTAEVAGFLGKTEENIDPKHVYVLDIPEVVEKDGKKYSVTAIGDQAFENNRYITEVNMPKGLVEIGDSAFNCCTALKKVSLYEGLNEIGDNAFFSCTRLKTIAVKTIKTTVPNGEENNEEVLPVEETTEDADAIVEEEAAEEIIEEIEDTVADEDTAEEVVNTEETAVEEAQDEDLAAVEEEAAVNDEVQEAVPATEVIPNTSESVETTANNVVTLPASLETLGAGAFYDCQSIVSLKVLGKLDDKESVGDYAFGCCYSLKKAEFEYAPYEISKQMFMTCSVLQEVIFNNELNNTVSIGDNAFINCVALKYFGKKADGKATGVVVPGNVTYIGSRAFHNCTSITKAEIPNCIIDGMAFDCCSELAKVTFTEASQKPISEAEGKAYIGESAFASTIVKELTLPAYVNKMEDGALSRACFENFYVHKDNKTFEANKGVLYNEACNELIAYPSGREATSYTVDSNVTVISDMAFLGCMFETIKLPSGLNEIGEYAFAGCYEMNKVSIPDSVTTIGEGAYADCDVLAEVELSKGINVIEDKLFGNCPGIKKIQIPEGVTEIGKGAFAGCYSLNSVNIPASVTEISSQAFLTCAGLTGLDISDANKNFVMENGVLYNKDKTKLITVLTTKKGNTFEVPGHVTEIEDHAFSANSAIKTVKIGDEVKKIGTKAVGFTISFDDSYTDRVEGFCVIVPKGDSEIKEYAKTSDVAYFTGNPTVDNKEITLEAGETAEFSINNSEAGSVLYTSSDESIVEVDRRTGELTGVSKGETAVVASIGTLNYVCNVTVTSGEKPIVEGTEYKVISNAIDGWEKEYNSYNAGKSFDPIDNSNLVEYTSNNYIAILAKTQSTPDSPKYITRSDASIGEGCYEQYSHIASNLSLEMSRFALNENLVLYRGTDDLSQYTVAKTSKLDDMYDSIGAQVKTGNKEGETRYSGDWVASTSVNHAVSFFFGSGSTRTVLEIYAPKNFTRGAYLDNFSVFEGECEILLDGGTTFEVVDAGVRQIELMGYGEPIVTLERYMKLQIVGVKGEEIRDFGTPVVYEVPAPPKPVVDDSYKVVVDKDNIEVSIDLMVEEIDTEQKIKSRLYNRLIQILGSKFNKDNTVIWDINLKNKDGDIATSNMLPENGLKITIPYPDEVKKDWKNYDFTILHMFAESAGGKTAGDIEGPMAYEKTKDGLDVVVYSMSPFAIHWEDVSGDDAAADTGDDTPIMPFVILILFSIAAASVTLTFKRTAKRQ